MNEYYFNVIVDTVSAKTQNEAEQILQDSIARGQYEIELDDIDEGVK